MSIVIPRHVWGPRYSNGGGVIGTSAWEAAGRELWLHHSITNPPGPNATLAEDCAHMRVFEQIGQDRFGQGISYTWVIMPSGRVFEGHSIDRRGAHTYQRNDRSRAVCLAGNFETSALPDRMAHAAAALLRELGATFDGGHRDVFATACPGDHAYGRLPEINRLATSGGPLSTEDDMPFGGAEADFLLNRPVTITAPGNPKYSETRTVKEWLGQPFFWDADNFHRLGRVEAKLDALAGTLSDDEANIVAAVRAASDPDGPTDYERLGKSIAANLPAPSGGMSPEDLERELNKLLGRVYRLNDTTEGNV